MFAPLLLLLLVPPLFHCCRAAIAPSLYCRHRSSYLGPSPLSRTRLLSRNRAHKNQVKYSPA
ncbi:uncharacterized protein DS421_20g696410 [Arachis hypogaea]|nr:uncharacterized protein DS421_20g696410 [Arachis hypogaea]